MDANTTGGYNTALGAAALDANTTASNNTAIGAYALSGNTEGANNTSVGRDALIANTTGGSLVAMGHDALSSNTTGSGHTVIGKDAGANNTTGVRNSFFGEATRGSAVDTNDAHGFGYDLVCDGDYTTLGRATADIRAAHGNITWATVSDERYKKDIVDSTAGLSLVNALQPRTFKYKNLGELPSTFNAYKADSTEVYKNSNTNHGFIAQEVKTAIDADAGIKDGFRLWDDREDGSQEVAEAALIPVLVKAIQELSAEIEILKNA
jgi:hypothetical protein